MNGKINMKITCTTQDYEENILDQFIGTGKWVRCVFNMTSRHNRTPHWSTMKFWVCIESRKGNTYTVCSSGCSNDFDLDERYLSTKKYVYFNEYMRTERVCDVKAVEPLTWIEP